MDEKRTVSMLTTIDNPFDPFVDFEAWLNFDSEKGYFSCAYLSRVAASSHELSQTDEDLAIEAAIDEIVKYNVLGLYKKVQKEMAKTQK